MPQPLDRSWWREARPVIGMLHAAPLPGSPRYAGDWPDVIRCVLQDADALIRGGVHGLMLENFGDVPFYPARVPPETIACLTRLACEVRRRIDLPLGINVLRNDGEAAIAVAQAAGADFIRVNVLCGARVGDQGVLQGCAHEVLRLRSRLSAQHVQVLADVDVKHSAPLAQRAVQEEVSDTIERGLADAVIVSGAATGALPDLEQVQAAARAAGAAPVLVGSGVSPESLPAVWNHADGFIVGTYFKADGKASSPVDEQRVRTLLEVHGDLLRSGPRVRRDA